MLIRTDIDQNSSIPLYEQVKNLLREKILNGDYPPGSQLPTEQELCEAYHISRITAKRALDDLAVAGIIRRVQGKGTFVAPSVYLTDEIMGFTGGIRNQGMKPGSKLLSIEIMEANQNMRRIFSTYFNPLDRVINFRRLFFVDEIPCAVVSCIVPEDLGLEIQKYELDNVSFYGLIKKILGRGVIYSDTVLTPIIPNATVTEMLKLKPGSAHFHHREVSYIEGDIAVELGMGIYSANIFQWRSRVKTPGYEVRELLEVNQEQII